MPGLPELTRRRVIVALIVIGVLLAGLYFLLLAYVLALMKLVPPRPRG